MEQFIGLDGALPGVGPVIATALVATVDDAGEAEALAIHRQDVHVMGQPD